MRTDGGTKHGPSTLTESFFQAYPHVSVWVGVYCSSHDTACTLVFLPLPPFRKIVRVTD